MFLITTSRAFHSCGPATEKALSPNFVTVRGVRRSEPAAARNRRNSSSCVCDVGCTSAVIDYRQHTSQDRACNESDKRPVASVVTACYQWYDRTLADRWWTALLCSVHAEEVQAFKLAGKQVRRCRSWCVKGWMQKRVVVVTMDRASTGTDAGDEGERNILTTIFLRANALIARYRGWCPDHGRSQSVRRQQNRYWGLCRVVWDRRASIWSRTR